MGVRNPNSTNYVHADESNLLNIHKAMDYTGDGEPALRVLSNIQGDITIAGDVTIPGIVTVTNTDDDPLFTHTHLYDENDAEYTATNPLTIDGTVTVNQPVAVTDNNGSLTVDGSVSVSNFPATQAVTGTFWQATQPVSGTVTANVTFPSIYKVSKNTSDNTATNAIAVEISTDGQVVSGTNALPIRVLNDEGLIAYARGAAITEAEVLNAFLVDKSGATASLGTTAANMTTVWGYNGLFPWSTFTGTGDKLYIFSQTNDTQIQNKTITVEGLDSNYNLITDIVTFGADTTTPISTSINFYRINRLYLSGNNTNSLPHLYDIEVRYGSSSGTVVSYLIAPWGRAQNCFYTVPVGYEAFVLSMAGNSGKDDEITSSIWIRTYNGTWENKKSFKFISGLFDHNFRTPMRVPEKSDIELRAFALVESSSIGTEFQMLVIPKVP